MNDKNEKVVPVPKEIWSNPKSKEQYIKQQKLYGWELDEKDEPEEPIDTDLELNVRFKRIET